MKITVYITDGKKLIQIYEVHCWTPEDVEKVINNISPDQFYTMEQ